MKVAKDTVFRFSRVNRVINATADWACVEQTLYKASVSGERKGDKMMNGMSHEASNAGTSVIMGNETNCKANDWKNDTLQALGAMERAVI